MAEKNNEQSNISTVEIDQERDLADSSGAPSSTSKKGPLATLQAEEWWKWEIAGILGSAAAIAGIIGILLALNNKQQPSWARPQNYCVKVPYTNKMECHNASVSINSLISWLSTIAKICVFIPVTKGLGQLKWVWFAEKERTLADLETFDSATRGVTGSAMLVWKLRGRYAYKLLRIYFHH
jgi:hypothetical protein